MHHKHWTAIAVAVLMLTSLVVYTNLNIKESIIVCNSNPIQCSGIPTNLYEHYSNIPRPSTPDYTVYILDVNDNQYIETYTSKLLSDCSYTKDVDIINFLATTIQSIPYQAEPVGEYPKYPIETLTDNCGDCEDKSILLSSILYFLNYNTSLIRLPNHMAVGVSLDVPGKTPFINNYYFLESTQTGYQLGDVPSSYYPAIAEIQPVTNHPILTHNWTIAIHYGKVLSEYVKLNISIENIGFSNTEATLILSITNNEQNITESIDFTLDSSYSRNILITKQIPKNQIHNLTTHIKINNKIVDTRYGEFGNAS